METSTPGSSGIAPRGAARPALALAVALLVLVLIGTSTAHAATALAWTRSTAPGPTVRGPLALSCASSSLCVAVDGSGDALVSTDPGASASTWTPTAVSTGKDLTGVSCLSSGACVAVDAEGEIFAATAPTAWTRVANETGHDLTSVSCASSSLCVAVDDSGNALATAKPTSEWSTPQPIAPGDSPLLAVSCEASGACAATDAAGEVLTNTSPTATSGTDLASPYWSGPSLKAGALPALSCISGLCVTANAAGESFASENPDALPAQWSTAAALGKQSADTSVDAVSCLPASICVALAAPAEGGLEAFSANVPVPVPVPVVEKTPPPAKEALPAVTAVTPNPKISGTPAAGQTLTCEPGLPAGATATVTYRWLANTVAIAGATNPKYKVRSSIEGDHLQCSVTATNAAGSVNKTSSYVAIPLVKIPVSVGETTVSRATVATNAVSFAVDCSTKAVGSCKIEAALTLYERLRGTRVIGLSATKPAGIKEVKDGTARAAAAGKTAKARATATGRAATARDTTTETSELLTVGSLKFDVKPGRTRTIALRLNAAGTKLAGERKRLPTTFTVSGTVIGVIAGRLRSQTLSLKGATTTVKAKTKATKAKAGRAR